MQVLQRKQQLICSSSTHVGTAGSSLPGSSAAGTKLRRGADAHGDEGMEEDDADVLVDDCLQLQLQDTGEGTVVPSAAPRREELAPHEMHGLLDVLCS